MPISPKLLRFLYACEFLLALIAIFSSWSEIGGQATLDLMHWSWKFGFSFALAGAFVAYTRTLIADDSIWTLRSLRWLTAIALLLCSMGIVTYFYAVQVDAGDSDETSPSNVHHAVSSSLRTS